MIDTTTHHVILSKTFYFPVAINNTDNVQDAIGEALEQSQYVTIADVPDDCGYEDTDWAFHRVLVDGPNSEVLEIIP
jgi:hypothetical protein